MAKMKIGPRAKVDGLSDQLLRRQGVDSAVLIAFLGAVGWTNDLIIAGNLHLLMENQVVWGMQRC
jgi:hypothetical protein